LQKAKYKFLPMVYSGKYVPLPSTGKQVKKTKGKGKEKAYRYMKCKSGNNGKKGGMRKKFRFTLEMEKNMFRAGGMRFLNKKNQTQKQPKKKFGSLIKNNPTDLSSISHN
jgi:hypothetical protein